MSKICRFQFHCFWLRKVIWYRIAGKYSALIQKPEHLEGLNVSCKKWSNKIILNLQYFTYRKN